MAIKTGIQPAGTVFTFNGTEYRIEGHARVNYNIVRKGDLKGFKFPMSAPLDVVENPTGWDAAAVVANYPSLKDGDACKITGRGAGRMEGREGYVAKVNAATYLVVIPGYGSIKASHVLVKKR